MKPTLRSLAISSVVVVGYPILVIAVFTPFVALGLMGSYRARIALDALWMPLDLPTFILRSLCPAKSIILARMPTEQTILMLGWFVTFNIVLYYIPIRLFLHWRDQTRNLP